ncbi:MAG: 4-hydroxy-tetrahydrodipicolinate synthase [Coriobacteriaceae bacterium]|nr:4-hydroxy-tetrahydrodipicolinate synthase [Coriobacteriaceae bacterium]
MPSLRFGRMIPAMVTPFDDNLDLDCSRAQQLAARLVEGGADSLAVCATTGESPTLTHAEKLDLFSAVLEAVGGQAKIIANVGGNNTADSVAFARETEKLGVDGMMAVVPYYNKPPQEGLYQHYRAIAGAVDTPLIMYNIPGRCVINQTAETTLRLAHDVDNIVGIKEASGKMDQIAAIAKDAPDDFAVYSGDDAVTLEIMGLGGVGVISTTGNVAPAQMKSLVEAEASGRHEEAAQIHQDLLPLMKELFITSNPIMVKEALKLCGFSVGGLRLPLVDATSEQSAELADVLRQTGLIDE